MRLVVETEGFAELLKAMAELPKGVRNRVAIPALRAGGAVLSKEMKDRAPVGKIEPVTAGDTRREIGPPEKPGALKRAIGTRLELTRKAGIRAVFVGVRGKQSPLAHLIELGNTKHPGGYPIKPKKAGGWLAFRGRDGRIHVVKRVHRTPLRPHPFIRPALDAKGAEVFQAMRRRFYERLNVEVIRLANPGKKVRIVRT